MLITGVVVLLVATACGGADDVLATEQVRCVPNPKGWREDGDELANVQREHVVVLVVDCRRLLYCCRDTAPLVVLVGLGPYVNVLVEAAESTIFGPSVR